MASPRDLLLTCHSSSSSSSLYRFTQPRYGFNSLPTQVSLYLLMRHTSPLTAALYWNSPFSCGLFGPILRPVLSFFFFRSTSWWRVLTREDPTLISSSGSWPSGSLLTPAPPRRTSLPAPSTSAPIPLPKYAFYTLALASLISHPWSRKSCEGDSCLFDLTAPGV